MRGAAARGRRAGMALVDRDVAPGDHASAPRRRRSPPGAARARPRGRVPRQEAHRDAVRPGRRERAAEPGAEERVRELQRHPGAVAGVGVGARGAAVLEVRERACGAHDSLVARDAVEPRDERDAARVVLVGRVVEADAAFTAAPRWPSLSPVWCALDRWGEGR